MNTNIAVNKKWDGRFMELAKDISGWSKDDSTKVGAVVVGPDHEIITTGYNGPPRGVSDDVPERKERPAKYLYTAHAEANAVYNAARIGVSVRGCTMYIAGLPPCNTCAHAIIQAGISRIVVESMEIPDRWKEMCEPGIEMLEEADVDIWVYNE
jgi:dCMP deaminase